jgi:CRP-like cAMP-binding protein
MRTLPVAYDLFTIYVCLPAKCLFLYLPTCVPIVYLFTSNVIFGLGDIIVQQGDHAESIMFLTKGRCRVIRVLDLTTVILPVEVGELGPYEMFGDAPLCTSKQSQKRRNHSPHNASTAQSSPATRVPISHAEASPNADGHTEQLHGDHYRPLTCSVLANTNVEVLCINRCVIRTIMDPAPCLYYTDLFYKDLFLPKQI